MIKDLINNHKLLKLKDIKHHNFTNRFTHSVEVSYRSYKVGKWLGFSEDSIRSVSRAALLHDLFYETREEINALNCGSHNYIHPVLSLKNALEITEINELEEDIITKHMFLCTSLTIIPKYKESFLVSMVDKYVSITEVFTPVKVLAKLPVRDLIRTELN